MTESSECNIGSAAHDFSFRDFLTDRWEGVRDQPETLIALLAEVVGGAVCAILNTIIAGEPLDVIPLSFVVTT